MTRATVCVCGLVFLAAAIIFLIVLLNLFILLDDLPLQIVDSISLRFYCLLEVFNGLCKISTALMSVAPSVTVMAD